MSKAYKCDGCGEYHDGQPQRYRLSEFGGISVTGGWTGRTTVEEAERCGPCASDLEGLVGEWLEGDDDE